MMYLCISYIQNRSLINIGENPDIYTRSLLKQKQISKAKRLIQSEAMAACVDFEKSEKHYTKLLNKCIYNGDIDYIYVCMVKGK